MTKLAAIFLCALVIVGCGTAEKPSDNSSPSTKVVPIVIEVGKVTPQGKRVEVEVGQNVTLRVTSDSDDEVHVHSSPEREFKISAGMKARTFTFSIDTPGQVDVESHHLGVTIVQLVVRP